MNHHKTKKKIRTPPFVPQTFYCFFELHTHQFKLHTDIQAQGKCRSKRIIPTQCSPILNWSRKGVSGKLPFLGQFLTFCCLRNYMQSIFKSREQSQRFWLLSASCHPPGEFCLWSTNTILEIAALTILPQFWWLESPGRDTLDPGLRWECVFLQGAKTIQTHITSADWVSNSHRISSQNLFQASVELCQEQV